MNTMAVIGCGFGDEGKGRVVSYLCQKYPKALVVRFSGGHQARHHVITEDGLQHTFSNFGSGTFSGCPTYWRALTFDPVGTMKELKILLSKGVTPTLYLHADVAITTACDKIANCIDTENVKHGTCGVGFGKTVERNENGTVFLARHLYSTVARSLKLRAVHKYYGYELISDFNDEFDNACDYLFSYPHFHIVDASREIKTHHDDIIFEGSQGLMLDKRIGFFPSVTRSHTDLTYLHPVDTVYLVTRGYLTRHGNGPLMNEAIPHRIYDNPYECNSGDGIQGDFRKSQLSLLLLEYAINNGRGIREARNKTLVVTCLDNMEELSFTNFSGSHIAQNKEHFAKAINDAVRADNVWLSSAPYGKMKENKNGRSRIFHRRLSSSLLQKSASSTIR